MRAHQASSNVGSLWMVPSHYLSIIWSQASIFINGDLADGIHLENRSEEPLPSETNKAEGVKRRKMVESL